MQAVVYARPRKFELLEIALPEPGPGEARIRVELAGVCGTDLHIHSGDFFAKFPLTPGHEVVGRVDAVGEGVVAPHLGERVTVNSNAACGNCNYCRRGQPLLCRNLAALGVTLPGAFADYMVAPANACFVVDDLPVDVAVLTEPTACAVHGVEVAAPSPGSDALIFGAGPTGLILAQLLAHGGVARVTVAEPRQFKLQLARSYGIDETVLVGDDPGSAARRLREIAPEGFDLVVDATGLAVVSGECIQYAKDGGTVLLYGVTSPEDRISISPYEIYRREITLKGSFAQIHSFPSAIAALRTGRVRTEGLISHRFRLNEFAQALEALSNDETAHKIVLAP